MGLGIVSDLGVGRGEEMSLEAGLEDGEGLSRICWGREFQSLGDVLEKALSPRLWSFDVWVERRPAEEDLRARGGW